MRARGHQLIVVTYLRMTEIAHGAVRIGKKGRLAESWESPPCKERAEMMALEEPPEGEDGDTSRKLGEEGAAEDNTDFHCKRIELWRSQEKGRNRKEARLGLSRSVGGVCAHHQSR